jgi:hypothetical protein
LSGRSNWLMSLTSYAYEYESLKPLENGV